MKINILGLLAIACCAFCAAPALALHDAFNDGSFSIPVFKIMIGDNPAWADPDYDDSGWPVFTDRKLAEIEGIYWVRAEFRVGDGPRASIYPHELRLRMLASYELYFDGRLIGKSGVVGRDKNEETPGPFLNFFILPQRVVDKTSSVMAMRMSSCYRIAPDKRFHDPFGRLANNAVIQHMRIDEASFEKRALNADDLLHAMFLAVPLIVGCYFLFVFAGDPKAKHYLFFTMLCLALFAMGLADVFQWGIGYGYDKYVFQWWAIAVSVVVFIVSFPAFFLFKFQIPRKGWWMLGMTLACAAMAVYSRDVKRLPVGEQILLTALLTTLAVHFLAIWKKQKETVATAVGVTLCAVGLWINSGVFFLFVGLLMVLVLWQLARESRQHRRNYLQSLVNTARLEASLLRKSIQPHFLMNSLNSLMEWVEREPEKGAEFIEALGQEFHILTAIADRSLIPIEQELELCRLHLQIMGFRLQKRFRLELTGIEPDDRVPPAMFHTLVENGISHNRFKAEDVSFCLACSRTKRGRRYTFVTPFETRGERRKTGGGTGLKYIKAQLERVFPGRWTVASGEENGQWKTRIEIA